MKDAKFIKAGLDAQVRFVVVPELTCSLDHQNLERPWGSLLPEYLPD